MIGLDNSDILELFSDVDFNSEVPGMAYLKDSKKLLVDLGFTKEDYKNSTFPLAYNEWNTHQKSSFLHGCYSASGHVEKNESITYRTLCKEFANQMIDTLKNDFDINGCLRTNSHKVKTHNGIYKYEESYDVIIAGYKDIQAFHDKIGFYQQFKRIQLQNLLIRNAPHVQTISKGGKRKVYDFSEPLRHWGVVKGYIVHNCGELPLPSGGACLLGAINLSEYVINPFKENAYIDDSLYQDVETCVRALNDVLDEGLNLHPLEEQRQSARDWRQIGLGTMGEADMFLKLGIRYGSAISKEILHDIKSGIAFYALLASSELASESSGGTYPKWNNTATKTEFYRNLMSKYGYHEGFEKIEKYGLHNAQILTIAPTGSISTMLGVSGGAEPIFANSYTRLTKSLHGEDVSYKIYHPTVKQYMDENNIIDEKGLPEYFVAAKDIHYRDRIDMQAISQEFIDSAISSTINLPNSTTVEDIVDLYTYAWEKGLKGVTVFREGCKKSPILSEDTKIEPQKECQENSKKESDEASIEKVISYDELPRGLIVNVSDDVIGLKRKLTTGCGTLHCTAFFDSITGELLETYLNKGSSGGCNNSLTGLSRMISLATRGGVTIDDIVDQLQSTGVCSSYAVRSATKHDVSKGASCPIAVANALVDMHNEIKLMNHDLYSDGNECCNSKDISTKQSIVLSKQEQKKRHLQTNNCLCPECGEPIVHEGGCDVCKSCAWSKCS